MSKELAADYFSRHQSDECHIASDGRVFHTLGSAQSFASGLKDNKVNSYTRAEFETAKEKTPKDKAPKDDAPKVYSLEDLKAFDAKTATWQEAKELVKGLAIETPSQSKIDLFAAIEAQKVIINTEIQE
jgi:hypothetical protein